MAKAQPLVSVVIPVYNGARFLEASLESVSTQTYENLDIFVVDDGSTDETPEIVRSYRDNRLRYHRNPRNLGLFAAFNVGIGLARGEFVAIQHADDVYFPQIIQRETEFLMEHLDVGAVFAFDVFIDESGTEYARVRPPRDFRGGVVLGYGDLLNGFLRHMNSFVRGGTSLVRKEVYAAVGPYSTHFGIRGDLDMWLRLAGRAPIAILDEYLTKYRWGHENESARYGRLRTEPELFFEVIDERLSRGDRQLASRDALAAYEAHRAQDLLMVTVNRYVTGDIRAARETLRKASPIKLARSRRIQRLRMLALWSMLFVLVHVRRIGPVARAFERRWGIAARKVAAGVAGST